MAKANATIGVTVGDGGTIIFTVKGCDPFTFDPAKAHELMRSRAELHGWTQRISDGGALSRDPTTGRPATPEAKRARMLSIAEHYMTGTAEWALKAKAAGKRAFDVGQVVVAMIRAGLANDPDEANMLITRIMTKRDIDREASAKVWAATREVAQAIADMEAEKAPGGADDLLAELTEDETDDSEDETESE